VLRAAKPHAEQHSQQLASSQQGGGAAKAPLDARAITPQVTRVYSVCQRFSAPAHSTRAETGLCVVFCRPLALFCV
jgi:hypothetical protein